MSVKRNESRNEWIKDIALGLKQEFDLEHNESLKRAESLMSKISQMRAAGEYYWPSSNLSQRDAAIAKEFNGRNMKELQHRYGLTSRRIYTITSKAQEGHSAAHQPKKSLQKNRGK